MADPEITPTWIPSDPHRAANKLSDEGGEYLAPTLPERKAQKWRPQAAVTELSAFVTTSSSAVGDLKLGIALSAEASTGTIATADLVSKSMPEIAEAHAKVASESGPLDHANAHSHSKSAVLFDGKPSYISDTHVKTVAGGEGGHQRVAGAHVKLVHPADAYPVFVLNTHTKIANLERQDPRLGQFRLKVVTSSASDMFNQHEHIKTVFYESGYPLKVGWAHAKVVESEPIPLKLHRTHAKVVETGVESLNSGWAHAKVVESEPGFLRNNDQHAKVVEYGPLPYRVCNAHSKVVETGVESLNSGWAHAKVLGNWAPLMNNAQSHIKCMQVEESRFNNFDDHVKASFSSNPDRNIHDTHTKVATEYVPKTQRGWGVLL